VLLKVMIAGQVAIKRLIPKIKEMIEVNQILFLNAKTEAIINMMEYTHNRKTKTS
jgi:hypothetical protein